MSSLEPTFKRMSSLAFLVWLKLKYHPIMVLTTPNSTVMPFLGPGDGTPQPKDDLSWYLFTNNYPLKGDSI